MFFELENCESKSSFFQAEILKLQQITPNSEIFFEKKSDQFDRSFFTAVTEKSSDE